MPRPYTASEYLEIGKQHYEKAKYSDAVTAFTEAIVIESDIDLIQAYDRRAATYEKLDDLEKSLKDGRLMIKRFPDLVWGYIRTGKVLVKQNKLAVALEIYEYGLRKIPSDSTHAVYILHKACEAVKGKLYSPSLIDPFQALPVELITELSAYFEYREITALLRVSKSWAAMLKSIKSIWTEIDFTSRKKLSWKVIKACIQRAGGEVKSIVFYEPPIGSSWEPLDQICRMSNALRGLRFYNGDEATIHLINSVTKASTLRILTLDNMSISATDATWLLLSIPTLNAARFKKVRSRIQIGTRIPKMPDNVNCLPNLEVLQLSCAMDQFQSKLALQELVLSYAATPNLRLLMVQGFFLDEEIPLHSYMSQMKELRGCDINYIDSVHQLFNLPHTITQLAMGFKGTHTNEPSVYGSMSMCEGLPSLWELQIETSKAIDPELIDQLVLGSGSSKLDSKSEGRNRSSLVNLTSIEPLQTDEYLRSLCATKTCRNLKGIDIAFGDITDGFVAELPVILPKLVAVTITGCKITGLAIKDLIQNSKNGIERIKITSCPNVPMDAIDWAISQGVHAVMIR